MTQKLLWQSLKFREETSIFQSRAPGILEIIAWQVGTYVHKTYLQIDRLFIDNLKGKWNVDIYAAIASSITYFIFMITFVMVEA